MKIRALLLFVFACTSLVAQHNHEKCSTVFDEKMQAQHNAFMDKFYDSEYIPESAAPRYVPVAVHPVANTDGTQRVLMKSFLDRLCEVNSHYGPTEFIYHVKDVNFSVNNSTWNSFPRSSQNPTASGAISAMPAAHKRANMLNLFLHGSAPGSSLCGLYVGNSDACFVGGSCLSAETIAHEFGHHFSLPHTFFGWEGELPNSGNAPSGAEMVVRTGSIANCSYVADRFCDTGPDYIMNRWNPPSNCESNTGSYVGQSTFSLRDFQGNTFKVDGTNIMSYSSDFCVDNFSPNQQTAMQNNLNNTRAGGLGGASQVPPAVIPVAAGTNLTYPINGETTPFFNTVDFTWSAVPNAKWYTIEIYQPIITPQALKEYALTTTPNFTSFKLEANKTYQWRVLAFNEVTICNAPYSINGSFKTGLTTSTNTIEIVESFVVRPNFINGNETVKIDLMASDAFDGSLRLTDISGRDVQEPKALTIYPGKNLFEIETSSLANGIYVLSLNSSQGILTERITINR